MISTWNVLKLLLFCSITSWLVRVKRFRLPGYSLNNVCLENLFILINIFWTSLCNISMMKSRAHKCEMTHSDCIYRRKNVLMQSWISCTQYGTRDGMEHQGAGIGPWRKNTSSPQLEPGRFNHIALTLGIGRAF